MIIVYVWLNVFEDQMVNLDGIDQFGFWIVCSYRHISIEDFRIFCFGIHAFSIKLRIKVKNEAQK